MKIKMNWMIIVGIIIASCGVFAVPSDFSSGIAAVLIGIVFLLIGLRKNGILRSLFRKKSSGTSIEIPAYHYNDVKFFPPAEIVDVVPRKYLRAGAKLTLRKEPSNSYDDRAVAIYSGDHKIGYLLRNRLQDMANEYIDCGWHIDVTLDKLKKEAGEYHGSISMSFYNR